MKFEEIRRPRVGRRETLKKRTYARYLLLNSHIRAFPRFSAVVRRRRGPRKLLGNKSDDLTNDRCQRRRQCSRITVSFFNRPDIAPFRSARSGTVDDVVDEISDVRAHRKWPRKTDTRRYKGTRRRGYHQRRSLIVGVEAARPRQP